MVGPVYVRCGLREIVAISSNTVLVFPKHPRISIICCFECPHSRSEFATTPPRRGSRNSSWDCIPCGQKLETPLLPFRHIPVKDAPFFSEASLSVFALNGPVSRHLLWCDIKTYPRHHCNTCVAIVTLRPRSKSDPSECREVRR